MSKARARERAKAKAGQKNKKRNTDNDQADQKNQHGHFGAGATSIKSPGMKGLVRKARDVVQRVPDKRTVSRLMYATRDGHSNSF